VCRASAAKRLPVVTEPTSGSWGLCIKRLRLLAGARGACRRWLFYHALSVQGTPGPMCSTAPPRARTCPSPHATRQLRSLLAAAFDVIAAGRCERRCFFLNLPHFVGLAPKLALLALPSRCAAKYRVRIGCPNQPGLLDMQLVWSSCRGTAAHFRTILTDTEFAAERSW
jgi:hypothetical protein